MAHKQSHQAEVNTGATCQRPSYDPLVDQRLRFLLVDVHPATHIRLAVIAPVELVDAAINDTPQLSSVYRAFPMRIQIIEYTKPETGPRLAV